jgi:hypothetical protein
VERAIKEALAQDKARIKVARISRNGTLEITRQRIRSALGTSVFDRCQACRGTGHVLNPSSHAIAVLRKLRDRASRGDLLAAKVRVEPEAANRLRTEMWGAVQEVERRFNVRLDIMAEHAFGAGQDDFSFDTDGNAQVSALPEPNFGPAPRPEDFGEPEAPSGHLWADDDLADSELRALELLDKEDEAKALAEEHALEEELAQEIEEEENLNRRRRKSLRGREPKAKPGKKEPRRLPSKRGTERLPMPGSGDDSLDMPTYAFIDPRSVARPARPRRSLEALEDETRAAAGAARAGREPPRRRLGAQDPRPRRQRNSPANPSGGGCSAFKISMRAPLGHGTLDPRAIPHAVWAAAHLGRDCPWPIRWGPLAPVGPATARTCPPRAGTAP